MKNNSGQALVEFVLILPVFFIIIFGAVDFGNLIYKKYHMESNLDLIVDLYNQNRIDDINKFVSSKELKISYKKSNNILTISVSQDISIITPGVNLIFREPYTIVVDRMIYND